MCLSISDGSTEVEEQIRSMWEVSTQTLASLMALRRRVTTTHAKMGMLLREASIGPFQLRAEEEIAKLILSGVKSHRQRLENHFGIWCMTWIQNLQSLALPNYRSIVIGNTDIVPAYESPAGARFRNDTSDGRGDWLLQSGIGGARVGRVKSLVLYGPSQTGKTTWARSLGAHIYQVGLLSGSECMKAPDVEYAVFDDIRGGMKFFPSFKSGWDVNPMSV